MPEKVGPKPHPRRSLAPSFLEAISGSGRTADELSRACGFPFGYQLAILRRGRFPATPLTLARLTILARLLAHDGPILEGDGVPVLGARG
jgi:hypothetical protein